MIRSHTMGSMPVSYTGPSKTPEADCLARKIISRYELYRKGMQGKAAGLKA
jgi:hypothetical protein